MQSRHVAVIIPIVKGWREVYNSPGNGAIHCFEAAFSEGMLISERGWPCLAAAFGLHKLLDVV